MSDIIISVEELGKKYVLSHQGERGGYARFSEKLESWIKKPFAALAGGKKPARSAKDQQAGGDIGLGQGRVLGGQRREVEGNLPPTSFHLPQPSHEEFWALKDVSFEVRRGEVVGIIGRNGAGKSTLLKILSRITEPTEGRVTLRGRVASLLEVGTGFHPELTGRENIFLNGAILGMTKAEIKKKFDEIVAFAEVERFLDTPVKRYSSGMYVRLAFAVAAHLEPEILIVDEVLAVGDLQFQKKCLGKMQEVGKSGRTVLFVSHNMAAVKNLCRKAICLSQGRIIHDGEVDQVISRYIDSTAARPDLERISAQNQDVLLESIELLPDGDQPPGFVRKPNPVRFRVSFRLPQAVKGLRVGYSLHHSSGVHVHGSANAAADSSETMESGRHIVECQFRSEALAPGEYSLSLAFDKPPFTHQILQIPDAFLLHLLGEFCPTEVGLIELSPVWSKTKFDQGIEKHETKS